MSATNRGIVRLYKDAYPTPRWAVRRFAEALFPEGRPRPYDIDFEAWLEPCAGEGEIVAALQDMGLVPTRWDTVEIREECRAPLTALGANVHIADFVAATEARLAAWPDAQHYDLAPTNPPYNVAFEILQASLRVSEYVALLLRLGFLASEERAPWMRDHIPDTWVLPNRPCFRLNEAGKLGSDASEYAWFVWGPNTEGRTRILGSTPVKERKADEARCVEIVRANQARLAAIAATVEEARQPTLPGVTGPSNGSGKLPGTTVAGG